jgi:C-terminal processing protease CtpA/Prc
MLVQQTSLNWKDNFFSIGINLGKDTRNKTVIEGIWEDSPAARAEIPLHAEVISINRKPASHLSVKELNRILNDDRINTIELVLQERYQEKTYQLKKATLLP